MCVQKGEEADDDDDGDAHREQRIASTERANKRVGTTCANISGRGLSPEHIGTPCPGHFLGKERRRRGGWEEGRPQAGRNWSARRTFGSHNVGDADVLLLGRLLEGLAPASGCADHGVALCLGLMMIVGRAENLGLFHGRRGTLPSTVVGCQVQSFRQHRRSRR